MSIKFYRVGDEYGCFSNFAPYSFMANGQCWRTSEHFFQAKKFVDTNYIEKIRLCQSPIAAANLGRSRKIAIKDGWEKMKDDVMRQAVYEKFSQNLNIKKILLDTGTQEIIENTTTDYYWGCGSEESGKNMLGIILMETREKLRIECTEKT